MNKKKGDNYNKVTDIKQKMEEETEEYSADKVDPYSELIPPKATPMKKVFVWDPINEEYNLGTYQKGDSLLAFEEIQEVFKAIKPYAKKVLASTNFNFLYVQAVFLLAAIVLIVMSLLNQGSHVGYYYFVAVVVILFMMLIVAIFSYHIKHEKLQERIKLARRISIILRQLNANFFEEKGIHFYAGPHGTWVEMLISRPQLARKALGSVEIMPDDLNKMNSLPKPSPFNKFSVPAHQFGKINEEDEYDDSFLFP